MTFALTDDEQLTLIALMRYATRLDGRTSADEIAAMRTALREALTPQGGQAPYRAAPDDAEFEARIAALEARADGRFEDDDEVRRAALAVTRQEARETLFAAVSDVMLTASVHVREGWLLAWLEEQWELSPEFVDEGEPQSDAGPE